MSHRRVNGGAYNLRFGQSTIYSGATSGAENFIQALINSGGQPAEASACDVAEIIIYNTALSDLQVRQIENYLNEKWNVYPTNKFPFYRAPPAVAVFTPTGLTNLQLWLDAADVSTVTGTNPVTAWADKSGTGRNMSVGSGTMTYASKAVYFNNSYMLVTSAVNLSSLTFFIVTNAGSIPRTNQSVLTGRPSTSVSFNSTDGFGYYTDTTAAGYTNGVRFYGTSALQIIRPTTSIFMTSGTATAAGALQVFTNGTSGGTASMAARTTTAQGFSLGGEWNGTAYINAGNMDSFVYEVIVYNVVLTTTQRQQVEGYLAWKWGLQNNLPTTHPYRKFRP